MSFIELCRSKIIRFKDISNLFQAAIKGDDDEKSDHNSTVMWHSLWGYTLEAVLEGVGADINLKKDTFTFYVFDQPNRRLKQCICLPNSEWEFKLKPIPHLVKIWFPHVYSKTLTESGKKTLQLIDQKGLSNRLLITKVDNDSWDESVYEVSTYKLGDTTTGYQRITISLNGKTKVETMQFKGF